MDFLGYLDLFFTFFKIGLFSFGGGASMIPFLQQEVFAHEWLTPDQLSSYIAVSESTPGPIAINMATFIGSTQGGILGSVLATLGVVLPSFIIILLIAALFSRFLENKVIRTVLNTVRPVVVGMIIAAGMTLALAAVGITTVDNTTFSAQQILPAILTGVLAIVMIGYKLIFKKKIPVIQFILISAVVGLVACVIAEGAGATEWLPQTEQLASSLIM